MNLAEQIMSDALNEAAKLRAFLDARDREIA